jgi:hypothetical protein
MSLKQIIQENSLKNEPPRSKLRGISRLVAALKTKQASGNITRRDLSAEESAALWKLYLKSDEGIAIRSTFFHLNSELKRNYKKNDLYISKVKYINYKTYNMPEGNILAPFIHKRTSFNHEKEVRAIIQQLPIKDGTIDWNLKPPEDGGIYINIDPNVIIDMVYVSPDAQQWFKYLVESILKKYGLSKVVKRSSLSDDPIF